MIHLLAGIFRRLWKEIENETFFFRHDLLQINRTGRENEYFPGSNLNLGEMFVQITVLTKDWDCTIRGKEKRFAFDDKFST